MSKFMVYPIYSMDVREWSCVFALLDVCLSVTPLDFIIRCVTLYEFYDVSATYESYKVSFIISMGSRDFVHLY